MMSRQTFGRSLFQAIYYKGIVINEEDLEKFLDLNYDEDSDYDWDYNDFSTFADKVVELKGDFWEAVAEFNFHYPNED
jgi:hypothetical protein